MTSEEPMSFVVPLSRLTWKCDVCKRERPDAKIWVFKREITEESGLPGDGSQGTVHKNYRYCIDNPDCLGRVAYLDKDKGFPVLVLRKRETVEGDRYAIEAAGLADTIFALSVAAHAVSNVPDCPEYYKNLLESFALLVSGGICATRPVSINDTRPVQP